MNYQKVYMNQIYSSSLMGQVAQMWKDDILCDAVIKTGNVQTKAHRLVMIAACPVLQHMENASLGSHLEVRLSSEIKKDSVLAFLQYLYEGFMMLSEDNCKDIEKIGKLLHVDSVVKCCKDFFKCLSEKLGSSRSEKSSFRSSSEQPEFQHVRTSSLQKMVPENANKRAGSEESRPQSPMAKRKRTQRSVTPPSFSLSSDDSHSRSREHGRSVTREDDTLVVVSSECPERDEEGWPVQTDAPPLQKQTMTFSISRPSTGEKDLRVVNIPASAAESQPSTAASNSHTSTAAAPSLSKVGENISPSLHTDRSRSASPVQLLAAKPSTVGSQGKSFAAGSAEQAVASQRSCDQGTMGTELEPDKSTMSNRTSKQRESPHIPEGKTGTGTDRSGSQGQRGPDMTIIKVEHPAEGLEMSVDNEAPQPIMYGMDEEGDNSSDIEGATGDMSRDNSLAEGDLNVAWQDSSYQGLIGYPEKLDQSSGFMCKKCGETFDDGNDLVHHLRTVEKRKFCEMCKLCGEVFFLSRTYRYHLQVKHGISTNCPQCTICGSYFQDNYNLRRHVAIHSVERMFECSKCGGKFRQRHSMKSHEKNCKGPRSSDDAGNQDIDSSPSPEKKI